MRFGILVLALALGGSVSLPAQAASPSTKTKAPKVKKAPKIDNRKLKQFEASHGVPKRTAVQKPPKHPKVQAAKHPKARTPKPPKHRA